MRLAASLLGALPPEIAHRAAIQALSLSPLRSAATKDPRLAVQAFGLTFPHPLGLAAGFDKSAEAVDGLLGLGFGFVEVGTLTPRPQAGNPKPRLFRLKRDGSIVNRMGFNNDGYAAAHTRLAAAKKRGLVGVNVGPNKDSADRIADYVAGIDTFAPLADYLTINISSPNTPGLRDLHARDDLARLLDAALEARARAAPRRPLLLKISPDLDETALDDVLAIARERKLDGLIVSNTTLARPSTLTESAARESGGLSGRPLFASSTRLLARCFLRLDGAMPLIGAGGVEDAATALAKIEAGASLVQTYTGFIYRGPGVIGEVVSGLGAELSRRGAGSVAELVGVRAKEIAAG